MLLAEELPLPQAESELHEAARVAHYTDGTTEIQNERIAAYLERGIPVEATGSTQ